MKKTTLLILLFVSVIFSSCNQQTLESYNNTIVASHSTLFDATNNFYEKCENYIGKPESKKDLLKLIKETKAKLVEGRKPVDALTPFKDHGLRDTMLEMYTSSEQSMDSFAANADVVTGSDLEKAMILFKGEYDRLIELDTLIKELQVQYAYDNKGELR
ncbi:hypothetical protein ACFFLS_04400 [Flavobacterium procerum]|uniref:Lipoprotein n=1 Tax=Flavobacterium procerum TaxID=1455569 RepID=A0ABV6BLE4_9FLAO